MLIEVNRQFTESLSRELRKLSPNDKAFFYPHKFDIVSIKNLSKEKGNHYYIYLGEQGEFIGYGMLRTFGKHKIPTLGCVIWQKYRGQGYGNKLVSALIDKAIELKYMKIRLRVHPDNRIAYELYENNGFTTIGISEDGLTWMEYTDRNA